MLIIEQNHMFYSIRVNCFDFVSQTKSMVKPAANTSRDTFHTLMTDTSSYLHYRTAHTTNVLNFQWSEKNKWT